MNFQKWLNQEVRKTLRELNVPYRTINVSLDENLGYMMDLKWTELNDLKLVYSQLLEYLDRDNVKSLLQEKIQQYAHYLQRTGQMLL